jgi:asparagine synthase (glutamine-hydrolysing)
MIADVPVGAFLSGGVDSTGIVAFAREQDPDMRCFTIRTRDGRDEGETDDLPFAQMAADHLDLSLDIIDVDADQIPRDIEKMIWHLDEPISDPASLNTLYISELARKNGIKVLLSGTGGDDLFSGYRRHHALAISQHLNRLPSALRGLFVNMLELLPARGGMARRRDKLAHILAQSEQNGLPTYFLWGMKDDLDKLFLAPAQAPAEAEMQQFLSQADSNTTALQQMLALDQRYFLADHNLIYADKMGMAASVEIRVPFLDLDLVRFAARIPDRFKLRGRQSKWALKQALKNDIPNQILTRPKTGFGAPIRRWMKNELKEFMSDTLSYDAVKRRGLFDADFVQRLMIENNSGSRDAAYTLFSLLSVEIWCQKFLDR